MQDKYLKYNAIELASEDGFISWVQKGCASDNPWHQWIVSNPNMTETVEEAKLLVRSIQFKEKTPEIRKDQLWSRIDKSIISEAQGAKKNIKVVTMNRRSTFRLVGYAAAACIAGILIFQAIFSGTTSFYAKRGATLAHTLPDQSQIELNADSRIEYNAKRWDKKRALSLEGEAFFQVEKGQKFTVNTEFGSIAVLGTSFNIYSRDDKFEVHCTTGRVEVRTKEGNSVVLNPDEKTYLNNEGDLIKEELEPRSTVPWRQKIYRFDEIPLHVVFDAVERQFDVNVELEPGIEDRLYTGVFEARDLDKALRAICFPMELQVIERGKTIRIASDEIGQ
ncbi:MAG: FecR domain-containing protein [Bacteroidia bacterium]|nr:FecR domain-containing protein [Bacteroidia bacterium]